ncbi:MAG: efflux RND transporter periplasmic adaptor subunit [bacterium]
MERGWTEQSEGSSSFATVLLVHHKTPAHMKTSYYLILAFIPIGILLWYLLKPSSSSDGTDVQQTEGSPTKSTQSTTEVIFPVDAALAHRGNLIKWLTATGTLRAKREAEIVARTSGEALQVEVHNGSFVRQGDLLMKLDEREKRISYDRAASALLAAQIEYRQQVYSPYAEDVDSVKQSQQLKEAEKNLEELEKLWRGLQVNEIEYARKKRNYEADIAILHSHRNDVQASRTGLSSAREAFERAKFDLESTEIKAPYTGYIADCDITPGMQISMGRTVLKLVDLSSLLVDVEVLESEIGKLHLGRRAEVIVNAYPAKTFFGAIIYINPIVDTKTKTVKVTIELKDGTKSFQPSIVTRQSAISTGFLPQLRPGMFATVRIETDIFTNRLLVPKAALLVRDQRNLIFYKEGDLAKWNYVDVGEENEEFIEILRGQYKEVVPGDTVLIGGHYTLAHDAKVRVVGRVK